MKIGLVSIKSSIPVTDYEKYDFDKLYTMLGYNSGNLLFTRAVERQLDAEIIRLGFAVDPQFVKEKQLDAIVIPAANWLRSNTDYGFLVDKLEQTDIPVIIIGIGAQAPSIDEIPKLKDGTFRFLKLVANRSNAISVRGEYTGKVLEHYGIYNYVVTGCPSLYSTMRPKPASIQTPVNDFSNIVLHTTRYNLTQQFAQSSSATNIHKLIFEQAYLHKFALIYQSAREEMQLLYDNEDDFMDEQKKQMLAEIYGAKTYESIKEYILTHTKFFTDVDVWKKELQNYSFSIGTRLHGTIQGLLAGIPSVLVPHDTRTSEIAEFAGIPTISANTLSDISPETLADMFNTLKFDSFYTSYETNFKTYIHFLETNNLPYVKTKDL